jgi:hypothetical protein
MTYVMINSMIMQLSQKMDIKRAELYHLVTAFDTQNYIHIHISIMSANNFTGTNPSGANHPTSTNTTATSTSGNVGSEAGQGLKGVFAKGHVSLLHVLDLKGSI